MSDKIEKALCGNMRALMKTRAGKEVIWYLLSQCGIYTDVFTEDVSATHYMTGRRAIGLAILDLMQMSDPTMYPRLILDMNKLKEDKTNG